MSGPPSEPCCTPLQIAAFAVALAWVVAWVGDHLHSDREDHDDR